MLLSAPVAAFLRVTAEQYRRFGAVMRYYCFSPYYLAHLHYILR